MRGTDVANALDPICRGIIPACAGNSKWEAIGQNGTRDHPRVCGEQLTSSPALLKLRGSSPRVRGTVKTEVNASISSGIIPACAGNSLSFCTP